MNKPKVVVAEWREDSTQGVINSIILALVAGVGVVVYTKTRKGKSLGLNGKQKLNSHDHNGFDKFFNIRSRNLESFPKTSPIISKSSKMSSVISWLFGRESS